MMTVRQCHLGVQLHCGDEALLRPIVTPVRNRTVEWVNTRKPQGRTGFWTSTLLAGLSEWVLWCQGSGARETSEQYWYRLTPAASARLYVIETEDDLRHLCREYGIRSHTSMWGSWEAPLIDFERLATVCDGLHATSGAIQALHTSYPYDLNSWGVESTLWFSWCFEAVTCVRVPGDPIVFSLA